MSPPGQYETYVLDLSYNLKLKIKDKIYDATVFRHWTSGSKESGPREKGNKWEEPLIAQAYCLERPLVLSWREGKPKWNLTVSLSWKIALVIWWGQGDWSSQGHLWEKNCTTKELKHSGEGLLSLQLNANQWIPVSNLPETMEKNHTKRAGC